MNACLNVDSLVRWRPKSSRFYTSNASESGQRVAEFALDRFGRPFAPMEIVKIAARICSGSLNRPMPRFLGPKDEFI